MSSIDAPSPIVPPHAAQRSIAIVGLAALAALAFVLVPGLGLLGYPFRLLITILSDLFALVDLSSRFAGAPATDARAMIWVLFLASKK